MQARFSVGIHYFSLGIRVLTLSIAFALALGQGTV